MPLPTTLPPTAHGGMQRSPAMVDAWTRGADTVDTHGGVGMPPGWMNFIEPMLRYPPASTSRANSRAADQRALRGAAVNRLLYFALPFQPERLGAGDGPATTAGIETPQAFARFSAMKTIWAISSRLLAKDVSAISMLASASRSSSSELWKKFGAVAA